MPDAGQESQRAVPAQLGLLAIYNPSLGTTDETLDDQIVYYSSPASRDRSRTKRSSSSKSSKDAIREEHNEQLRQIGLAQGMVEFGRTFSDGISVDAIDTEKSRIILHELEAGWWMLASINLTTLPITSKTPTKDKTTKQPDEVEYSSREVKTATLLLVDLLQAHSTFLLHHASSMSALFVRNKRSKFIGIIGRYWDTFISTWNVLMHGNPANNLYAGIKIAACGELGVGVGEEERGSGEREVLEGFVDRVDGLVDVMVSKFGDGHTNELAESSRKDPSRVRPPESWLGSGREPASDDGTIFLGTGAISRKSLRDLSKWIEDLYKWGPHAYGVLNNPSSNRQTRESKKGQALGNGDTPVQVKMSSRQNSGSSASDEAHRSSPTERPMKDVPPVPSEDTDIPQKITSNHRSLSFHRKTSSMTNPEDLATGNKYMHFLKLGYGTHWSLGGGSSEASSTDGGTVSHDTKSISGPNPGSELADSQRQGHDDASAPTKDDSAGHFLIGLTGDIESEEEVEEVEEEECIDGTKSDDEDEIKADCNDRLLLRTLTLELEREEDARPEAEISIDLGNPITKDSRSNVAGSERTGTSTTSFESQDRNKTKKLQVVVYVNKPFIFVFLFELRTAALAWTGMYRSLHYQIGPLIKPLLASTDFRASKPDITPAEENNCPIYDLVWDPKLLTINSNIPNIPDPYQSSTGSPGSFQWSRSEALNTHMQILNTHAATTTTDNPEVERTAKTSKGWWVVWTRIPDTDPKPLPASKPSGQELATTLIAEDNPEYQTSSSSRNPKIKSSLGTSTSGSITSHFAHPFLDTAKDSSDQNAKDKEIFLIRRASDYVSSKPTSRFMSGASLGGNSESSWTAGPGKLAQGIGVDTKRYIDALLNLSG